MENRIQTLFSSGRPSFGTFLQLGGSAAAECAALAGFDYFILDTEHGMSEPAQAADCCRAAEARGITPLVRISQITRGAVLRPLDAGAKGLVVPGIQTVDEARALVKYGKYAPLGERGFCPTRCCGWGYGGGMAGGMAAYTAQCNRETLLLPQCETAGCLARIEEIAAMEGVDGIFVGPFDLSLALGMPGRFEEPALKDAFARVLAACRRAGKPALIFAPDPAAARLRLAQGFDSICCGADLNFMADAMTAVVQTFHTDRGGVQQ